MDATQNKKPTLQDAAGQGDLQAVKNFLAKRFLAKRPDINAKDENENTALDRAATRGQVEVTKFLLEQGADPNIRGLFGFTPLLGALGGQADPAIKKEVVGILLQHQADPNLANFDGRVPLMAAASMSLELCKLLVEAGADVNAQDHRSGETALQLAALYNQIETVRYLLEQGARADVADLDGYTPLIVAEKRGHQEVAELLRKSL